MRDKYVTIARQFAKKYDYEVSEHIINVMVSIMMHRDDISYGGGFVKAIISNNLDEAISRADSECINYLPLFSLIKRYGHL